MKTRNSIYRRSLFDFLRGAVLPVLFSVLIIFMVFVGVRQADVASGDEGLRILEDSLRRAVVMNYAIEGRFPESVEYIEERFGIYIDRTRFVVHYRIFASNILPEITVIPL